jgi:toxin ParE1/3/4
VTTVTFEREAEDDALEAYDWYEQQRPGLGMRFRDALDAAVALLAENPRAFPVMYRDLRRVLVERFPYAVYYRIHPSQVSVVAIFHGRRNPRVLQDR